MTGRRGQHERPRRATRQSDERERNPAHERRPRVHQRETGELTRDTLDHRVPDRVDETGEEYQEDDFETHGDVVPSSNRTKGILGGALVSSVSSATRCEVDTR